MGKVIGFLGRAVKRAVTGEGKNLLGIKNTDSQYDLVSAGALAIRVGLAVLVLYIAKISGFTVDQILEVVKQFGE